MQLNYINFFKLDCDAFPSRETNLLLKIELKYCDRLSYKPDYEISVISRVEFKIDLQRFISDHLERIF